MEKKARIQFTAHDHKSTQSYSNENDENFSYKCTFQKHIIGITRRT